jgi:hypothetical protein
MRVKRIVFNKVTPWLLSAYTLPLVSSCVSSIRQGSSKSPSVESSTQTADYPLGVASLEAGSKTNAEQIKYLNLQTKGILTASQLKTYYENKTGKPTPKQFENFYQIVIEEANSRRLNSDIIAMMFGHETNWLTFTGDVDSKQNNFAGLGAVGNGAKGESFADVRRGVQAAINHFYYYVHSKDFGQGQKAERTLMLIKSKHKINAKSIKDFTGVWATDPAYANSISLRVVEAYKYSLNLKPKNITELPSALPNQTISQPYSKNQQTLVPNGKPNNPSREQNAVPKPSTKSSEQQEPSIFIQQ